MNSRRLEVQKIETPVVKMCTHLLKRSIYPLQIKSTQIYMGIYIYGSIEPEIGQISNIQKDE